MEALTIHQPWAWAIAAGLKLVENRSWLPSWKRLKEGDDLAIHAGQHIPQRDELARVRECARAMGRESEVPSSSSTWFHPAYLGRVIAVVTFVGIARAREDLPAELRPWWLGKYGWIFKNVRQLDLGSAPKERGQQGMWGLTPGVELAVRTRLGRPAGDAWRKTA